MEQPVFPEELRYIWEWYLELKGDNTLSFQEIQSWAELTQQVPEAWEVELLKSLDRLYWRTINV
jgi:hypothetical protein